jgi:alpha-N-arabinofuranosidase
MHSQRRVLRGLSWALAIVAAYLVLRARTTATATPPEGPGRELAQNGGFERAGAPAEGWSLSDQGADKGRVSRDERRVRSGRASIKLEPNERNGGDQPLAIMQVIPAAAYRGRRIVFSGYVAAEGGATAVLGMLSIARGRPGNLVVVTEPSGSGDWVRLDKDYDVPDDPAVQLVLLCSVGGQSGAAWFDDLSVAPPGEKGARARPLPAEPGPAARPTPPRGALTASVEVDAGRVFRQIPRTLYGTNVEWVYNGYALWLERERRPSPQMLRLTQDLGVTLIRYPAGYYADFYHWRDGVGPFEKRPEALHQAGSPDRSRLNFGTDEALEFARQVGAELLITVNAGTGTAQEAADWVRYVNGKQLRVRYWEVGNELYIRDGSPISKATTVDPAGYAARFREFARAMRAADPRIKIGAIGGENQGSYSFVGYPNWNKIVLQRAGDEIDFLAVHNAYAPVMSRDHRDLRTVYGATLAAPVLIARNLRTIAQQINDYAPGRPIEIAVTEWGPLFQADPSGRYIDHNKTLGAALFAASAFKRFLESPRTGIANFHVLNDLSMMGWISSRNGTFPPNPDWAATARYYAFQLYSRHFGDQLVPSWVEGPTYDSEAVGTVDAVKDVPWLDVVASLSSDRAKLYVLGVNKHFDSPIDGAIAIRGFRPASEGTAWTLTGTGIDAHTGTTHLEIPGVRWARQAEDEQNPRFSKGGPGEITLSPAPFEARAERFVYRFPPHSVTSLVLSRR